MGAPDGEQDTSRVSGSAAVPGWRGPAGGAGYGRIAAFEAHVLRVLIASPGDTTDERGAVERSLHGWNASRAEREQVILLPARWETDAVPRLGGSGQSVINEQLVDRADIMIALFDSRLGQAAEEAVSGAAEEIQRAHEAEAGKPVHVYFSEEPLPRNVDVHRLSHSRLRLVGAGAGGQAAAGSGPLAASKSASRPAARASSWAGAAARSGRGWPCGPAR